MRVAPAIASVAVVAFALAGVSGCGGSGKSASPSASPNSTALQLKALAAASTQSLFSATYAATVNNQSLTVAVYVQNPTTYRVDVTQDGTTASLYGTANGSIGCSTATGVAPACFLIAGPNEPIPAGLDAGVQRIFSRDLPALASNANAFNVVAKDDLPADGALPAARCYSIAVERDSKLFTSGLLDDVDLGTYCLSASGPPRRLDFTSGSLVLQTVGPAPTTEQLTPPVTPIPLPSPTATSTASPSTPLGLLGTAST